MRSRRFAFVSVVVTNWCALSDSAHQRIEEHAASHSSVSPDTMNADPLTLHPEARRMAGGKTILHLRA